MLRLNLGMLAFQGIMADLTLYLGSNLKLEQEDSLRGTFLMRENKEYQILSLDLFYWRQRLYQFLSSGCDWCLKQTSLKSGLGASINNLVVQAPALGLGNAKGCACATEREREIHLAIDSS